MFSLSTHIFAFYRLGESEIKSVAEYGFNIVELWGAPPHFDYRDRKYVGRVKEFFEKYGVSIASVHSPFYQRLVNKKPADYFSLSSCEDRVRNRAIDETLFLLDSLDGFSLMAPVPVVIHTGIESEDEDDIVKCKWDNLAESVEKLLKKIIGSPFILALENGSGGKDRPRDVAFFVSGFSSPYLRLCFDVGHASITDRDWIDVLEEIKKMVVDYHIHDNSGFKDEHLPPGEGSIDFDKFFKVAGENSLFTLELMDYSRGEDKHSALVPVGKSIKFLGRRGLWNLSLKK